MPVPLTGWPGAPAGARGQSLQPGRMDIIYGSAPIYIYARTGVCSSLAGCAANHVNSAPRQAKILILIHQDSHMSPEAARSTGLNLPFQSFQSRMSHRKPSDGLPGRKPGNSKAKIPHTLVRTRHHWPQCWALRPQATRRDCSAVSWLLPRLAEHTL